MIRCRKSCGRALSPVFTAREFTNGCRLRWNAEQIALGLDAAFSSQKFKLPFGLDAFGGDGDTKLRAQSDDRAHDRRRVMVVDVMDEGAVDLDLVDGEAAEIAERRIADAEIVQRNADAQVTQL